MYPNVERAQMRYPYSFPQQPNKAGCAFVTTVRMRHETPKVHDAFKGFRRTMLVAPVGAKNTGGVTKRNDLCTTHSSFRSKLY